MNFILGVYVLKSYFKKSGSHHPIVYVIESSDMALITFSSRVQSDGGTPLLFSKILRYIFGGDEIHLERVNYLYAWQL